VLKTNERHLVKVAVQGKVSPAVRFSAFEMDAVGRAHSLPGVGGITYNVKVGDPAFGWQGDHIEPGVSLLTDETKRSSGANMALQFLACCGNEAQLVSGDAKGAKGVVTGHHGGVEHLMVDFSDRDLSRMTLDDKVLIRGFGQGLELLDFPEIKCYNLAPNLLQKMRIRENRNGTLTVPVVAEVPGALMGSGIGHADPGTGDYDITTQDVKVIKKHRLDKLRLGDFVALMDSDNTYGRHFLTGAVTIGVVIHSNSILSGHGPGVATLLSSRKSLIKPVIDSNANIANRLKIGRSRLKGRR
jgi:hypothetical protein